MDDPNITMEEYIRLEKEKARKRGKVFNWKTAKYGRIWYDEDVHDLRYVETEFLAIAFNDQISSEKHFLVNPRGQDMAHLLRDQSHQYLRYEGLQYSDADIVDFKARLTRIYKRELHRVHVFYFGGLSDLMTKGLSARMLMEHMDAQGVSLFTSRAWRRLFNIRDPLVHELILEFFSTFRFGKAILDLDTPGAL
ncbi:hypothetical protein Tco_1414445 [Tanacetum coccineum]